MPLKPIAEFKVQGVEEVSTSSTYDPTKPHRRWKISPNLLGTSVTIPAIENGVPAIHRVELTEEYLDGNVLPVNEYVPLQDFHFKDLKGFIRYYMFGSNEHMDNSLNTADYRRLFVQPEVAEEYRKWIETDIQKKVSLRVSEVVSGTQSPLIAFFPHVDDGYAYDIWVDGVNMGSMAHIQTLRHEHGVNHPGKWHYDKVLGLSFIKKSYEQPTVFWQFPVSIPANHSLKFSDFGGLWWMEEATVDTPGDINKEVAAMFTEILEKLNILLNR